VTANLTIRHDFRGVRNDPVEDLNYAPVLPFSTPATENGAWFANESYTYLENGNTVKIEWSGIGVVVAGVGGLISGTFEFNHRIAYFHFFLQGDGIFEKTTVTDPQGMSSVSTRTRSFGIEAKPPAPGSSVPTFFVIFEPGYTAAMEKQQYLTAGASSYNSQDVNTIIKCGPFTSEFPPRDDLGGR
jgi:hypothetical protein